MSLAGVVPRSRDKDFMNFMKQEIEEGIEAPASARG